MIPSNVDRFLEDPAKLDEAALDLLGARGRQQLVEEAKRRIDELARSDPPGALPLAEMLGRVSDSDPGVAVVVHRGRATAFHSNGRSREALSAYLEALAVYEAEGNDLEAGRVLRSLVDVYQLAGQPEESLRRAEEAREIFTRLGEERLLAQLETNVGNVYVRLDDYPRARASYLSACARLEQARLPLDLAIARYNLAIVESQSGMFAEAERTFQAARAVFASEGMDVHVADCMYMLSLVQSRRGSFAEAIAGLEEARRMYGVYRKPRGMPLCDLDLAEIYLRLDARREAVDHAARSARGFERLELEYERAKAETIHGVANLRQNDVKSAAAAFARARAIFDRQSNAAWTAIVDLHRSELEVQRGEFEGATRLLRDARRTLEQKQLVLWCDLASIALARALVLAERSEEAELVLQSLVSGRDADRALDAIILAQAYRVLGDLRMDAGDPTGAAKALERVVEIVEGVWGELPRADIRIAFFRSPHGAYVDLAWLRALEHGDPAHGLEVFESGRFRSWNSERVTSPSHSSARERLAWYLTRRLDSDVGAPGGEEELGGTSGDEAKLREAESELARLRANSRRPAFDLESLRASVGPDETLVAYALGKFGALAWLVTEDDLQVVPLDVDSAELERLRRKWFFHVDKLRFGPEYWERNGSLLEESAASILGGLGQKLLAPLAGRLHHRRVVLVPYGPLHGLPFHAFPVDGVPFGARFDISYGLSVRHVAETRGAASERTDVWVCRAQVDDLPELEGEADRIMSIYGQAAEPVSAGEVHGLLGADRGRGGLLHLASHGVFRPDNPVMSALLLGDTMLTSSELDRMNLEFDLVTLSGCETGRTQVSGGEEAFGLAHSFLRGGTRAVLCSLWPVHDRDSARFMSIFYERLAGGDDARRAFAEAQSAARARNPHAASWSAFVLLGAPNVRVPAG